MVKDDRNFRRILSHTIIEKCKTMNPTTLCIGKGLSDMQYL